MGKDDLERLSKRELIRTILRMQVQLEGVGGRVEDLEQENEKLKAELARRRKNSSTSSKPPSSDIVDSKKKPRAKRSKRKIGGQRGHPRHERKPFTADEIDKTREYRLPECPDCGGALEDADVEACVVQRVELVDKPTITTEHQALAGWCPTCPVQSNRVGCSGHA